MKITFLKTGFSAQNLIYRHLTVKHLFVCTKHLIQLKDALMYFLLHFVFFMFLNSMVNLGVKHRCRWGILRFGGCRLFKLCNNGSWKVSWEDDRLFLSCSRLIYRIWIVDDCISDSFCVYDSELEVRLVLCFRQRIVSSVFLFGRSYCWSGLFCAVAIYRGDEFRLRHVRDVCTKRRRYQVFPDNLPEDRPSIRGMPRGDNWTPDPCPNLD